MLYQILERLRGSTTLGRLNNLAEEPFASPEEIERKQVGRLRALLKHCERSVPYYRDLFHDLNFSPSDVRRIGDLAALPVLTKDIVRSEGDRLVRDDVPIDTLLPHFSGGSTGVPLRFWRDPGYVDDSQAGVYRNFLQCGWVPGDMVAFFWGFDDRLNAMRPLEFELRQRLRRFYQFDPFSSGPEEMERWIRAFTRIRPRIAHGYASTIGRFATHIERTGAEVPRLKGVFTTAEKLLPDHRDTIERVFGCKVFDCYGSSEVQNVAAECPRGSMHVNADFVVLETQDDAEIELPSGGIARPLLVTSLKNYAMPFVRYRNEDLGSLDAATCGCGNGFPLMRLQIARLSDNFPLPDGSVVHGEFFTHLMYGASGVDAFQFRQTELGRIDLLVKPLAGQEDAARGAAARAIEQLRERVGEAVHLEVLTVDSFELSRAGKHRFTWSQVS